MPNNLVEKYIFDQNAKRDLWESHDSPETLTEYLKIEIDELAQALQESYITGDVFSFASEMGDIQYLLIRLGNMVGIDPMQAAEMKVYRNSYKYADHVASNGREYPEAARVMKDTWKALGGDAAFSHVYLDYLAHSDGG